MLLHFGRRWEGHEIEDSCPCNQAPCGLIEIPDPDCPHHSFLAARTMRQVHRADDCPAQARGKRER